MLAVMLDCKCCTNRGNNKHPHNFDEETFLKKNAKDIENDTVILEFMVPFSAIIF
jgi:hypothetical protein